MDGEETIARLRLIRTSGVGPVGWHQLLRRYGSAAKAIYQLPSSGLKWGSSQEPVASLALIEDEIRRVSLLGARHIFYDHADYPVYLKQVDVPPPVLIIKGRTAMLQRPSVAIIGARNASAAACRFARQISSDLADAGVTVVSGLARGVDTAAHIGALGGHTAAVIGCGIDVAFPPDNAALQDRIADEHLLISEYPPGTEALARQFPARNRIIAGSTMATLVVEAAPKSGSLITARQAGDYGRDVLAVPGSPMDPRAQGCNRLIQDGATLIQNADDVLAALRPMDARMADRRLMFAPSSGVEIAPQQVAMDLPPPDDGVESLSDRIASMLSSTAVSVDELVRQSGSDSSVVQSVILDLELAGRIERHAGARISLR